MARWIRWIASGLAVLLLSACHRPSFRARELDPARPVPRLVLSDQHGRPFNLAEQRGRVVLVFFGYTRCPDVCPLTLGMFRDVAKILGTDAARVRFVFITLDPEVDTPAFLDRYLRLFSPEFVGLTGPPHLLAATYRFFGAAFQKVPVRNSAAGYLIAHSTNVPVIDREGRWRLNVSHEATAADVAHDVRQLLRH
ncbi:MAG: SCO family protein [Armatimonadota bacterium]|nr:SCO family protein [Armatimonadota bacterium]